jgi:hypothetical protein
MADRNGLGILGFIFGGVTAAVMLIATVVVQRHMDGRLALGDSVVEISAARMTR